MRSSCGIAMSLRKKLSSSILFWNATACGSPVATIPQIEPTTNAQNEAPVRIVIATRMYSPWLHGTIEPTPPPTCSIAT